jgi:hypothetical protein
MDIEETLGLLLFGAVGAFIIFIIYGTMAHW